jgi:hypothetical protein
VTSVDAPTLHRDGVGVEAGVLTVGGTLGEAYLAVLGAVQG